MVYNYKIISFLYAVRKGFLLPSEKLDFKQQIIQRRLNSTWIPKILRYLPAECLCASIRRKLVFRAAFVTKYVSIAIQRKQSFRFSFSYVCTYFWCGAVFDILKVTFGTKTTRSKNKQQKVSNRLRNQSSCENPCDDHDGFGERKVCKAIMQGCR